MNNPLRAVVKAGVIHQPLRHAEHLLQLAANFRRDARGKGRRQARAADLQQLQRLQLGIAAPFMDRLQPQADRRRHQRGDVDLMLFNQRETEGGAGVGGEITRPPARKTPSDPGSSSHSYAPPAAR